ncbi:MAG: hypothetical protein KKE20_01465 [Nanoarchaeota archaeon]|nr:hypothetical protein [Nanoarchaeota archaeon]
MTELKFFDRPLDGGVFHRAAEEYAKRDEAYKGGSDDPRNEKATEILRYSELELLLGWGHEIRNPEHLKLAAKKILSLFDQSDIYTGHIHPWDPGFGDYMMQLTPDREFINAIFTHEGSELVGGSFMDGFISRKSRVITILGNSFNAVTAERDKPYKVIIREIEEDPSKYLALFFSKREQKDDPYIFSYHITTETNSREYAQDHVNSMRFKVD